MPDKRIEYMGIPICLTILNKKDEAYVKCLINTKSYHINKNIEQNIVNFYNENKNFILVYIYNEIEIVAHIKENKTKENVKKIIKKIIEVSKKHILEYKKFEVNEKFVCEVIAQEIETF